MAKPKGRGNLPQAIKASLTRSAFVATVLMRCPAECSDPASESAFLLGVAGTPGPAAASRSFLAAFASYITA